MDQYKNNEIIGYFFSQNTIKDIVYIQMQNKLIIFSNKLIKFQLVLVN